MSFRSLTQLVAGMVFALVLLTACGDVDLNYDGNWPFSNKPDFTANKNFDQEVPVDGHSSVRLDGVSGAIAITGQFLQERRNLLGSVRYEDMAPFVIPG